VTAHGEFLAVMATAAAICLAILVGIPVLLMWIVNRFIGRRTAIALGLITAALVLYLISDTYRVCTAPPIYEAANFPCDAPGGAFIHLFIWIVGPIAVSLLLAATIFHYVNFRR
jgi:multisubunit Na+/H+ antiporter MnhC subunit